MSDTSSPPKCKQHFEPPQSFLLQHYCHINVHADPHEDILTGLMCEIDYKRKDPTYLHQLIAAGMTIARLNMRGVDDDERSRIVQRIRLAATNYSAELDYMYSLALMVDVFRPSIITGTLKKGPDTTLEISATCTITLTNNPKWACGGISTCLYINWNHLTNLKPDDIVYIDSLSSGEIKLQVKSIAEDSVVCTVIFGGIVGSMMTVRVPHMPLECDELDNDHLYHETVEDQLNWAVNSDVDAVLIRNTQSTSHINAARDIIVTNGNHIILFASIETVKAVDNIDDIIDKSDGVYFNRDILATSLPIERVFAAQKMIAAKCNKRGKSYICETALTELHPTLNITDIGNLVLDGTDVLSFQLKHVSSSKKDSPLNLTFLNTAAIICRLAERIVWRPKFNEMALLNSILDCSPTESICANAVGLASKVNASVIVCLTQTGRTAKMLAMAMPPCPIVAVTRLCRAARQMRFWRGLRSMHYCGVGREAWVSEVETHVATAVDYCRAQGLLHAGNPYIVVMGSSNNSGYCDSVRLLYASFPDTVNA